MAGSKDYNTIRTGVAAYITANVGWATSAGTFDYSPTDPSVVFGNMPAVIVDFDPRASIEWAELSSGYLRGIPFLIEVYTEVSPTDTSYGKDASVDLASKLREVEELFEENPYIGGLCKDCTIRSSKCETMQIDAVKLGVKARFAWLTLVVFALT